MPGPVAGHAPEEAALVSQRAVLVLLDEQEETARIASPALEAEISKASGAIRQVVLKGFRKSSPEETIQIGGEWALLSVRTLNEPIRWRMAEQAADRVRFEGEDGQGARLGLAYVLDPALPVVHVRVSGVGEAALTSAWVRADALGKRYNQLEAIIGIEHNYKVIHKKYVGPFRKEQIVPRGTFMAVLTERYFCQALRQPADATTALLPSSEGVIAAETRFRIPEAGQASASVYLGSSDYFQMKSAGFEQAVQIGMLGQIGLILLSVLSWIGGITHNYGIAVIGLAVLITGLTAPFTLLSFKSMKKMQELKPKMDRIMAQHKDDPKRANQEVMALYREHRVSPLSGCLPMIVQIPIFIALFQAISHYIELRGRGFLWISDLSLPDRLAELPFAIPFLGREFNLLPLLTAGAMYLQTKLSQQSMASADANPAAKMMSGPLMSVLFGVMFYHFPSGLVLYWLSNSLMSIILYRFSSLQGATGAARPA